MPAYATLEYAESYNEKRGRPDWAALSDAERLAALQVATDVIDAGMYIGGQPDGQRSKFPRRINGGVVPPEVIDACCEEAYTRACDKAAQEAHKRAREGLTSISIGNVSKGYAEPVRARYGDGGLWSEAARTLLAPWRVGSAVIV